MAPTNKLLKNKSLLLLFFRKEDLPSLGHGVAAPHHVFAGKAQGSRRLRNH
jgi:hypothetical protein